MGLAHKTHITRANEMLKGILKGIAIDYKIEPAELAALAEWLSAHAHLVKQRPFSEVAEIIEQIQLDQAITKDEHEALLEYFTAFDDENSFLLDCTTTASRRLHGVLHGISADGTITDQEIRDLIDWLQDYNQFKDCWPFNDLWNLLNQITRDKRIDNEERDELQQFCRNFSEKFAWSETVQDTPINKHTVNNAPVLYTLEGICDTASPIEIRSKIFCFTGHARSGKRKDLEQMIESHGGRSTNRITQWLDYLVVGALSSPCWVYSTYGRKIEQVVKERQSGRKTLIIHEDRLLEAINSLTPPPPLR